MVKTKVKYLKLGVNVNERDFIRMTPLSISLERIDTDSQLDTFREKYGELEVVIDRTRDWHSIFTVPSWLKETEEYNMQVKEQLKHWKRNKYIHK